MVNELLDTISHELLKYGTITKIVDIPESNRTLRVILYNYNKYSLLMQDEKCISVTLITK